MISVIVVDNENDRITVCEPGAIDAMHPGKYNGYPFGYIKAPDFLVDYLGSPKKVREEIASDIKIIMSDEDAPETLSALVDRLINVKMMVPSDKYESAIRRPDRAKLSAGSQTYYHR